MEFNKRSRECRINAYNWCESPQLSGILNDCPAGTIVTGVFEARPLLIIMAKPLLLNINAPVDTTGAGVGVGVGAGDGVGAGTGKLPV